MKYKLHYKGQTLCNLYERGPKGNRTLNLAREVVVVVRCAARRCGSSSAIFMMGDNKEQRVFVKFCFLLGKSAAETVLML